MVKQTIKRSVMFTFPQDLVPKPIIYDLVKKFEIIPNIRRADVSEDKGWMVLELEGKESDIEKAIAWVTGKGIRVDPVSGDIVEG